MYNRAYDFLMPKLESTLPAIYTYHNVCHTKSVIAATEKIAAAEGVDGEELLLLKTAALFHDAGFLKTYTNHEEASCQITREELPAFGYKWRQIEAVCQIIMATRLPQNPVDKLQQIICDADLHYLGTDQYFAGAEGLFKELNATGLSISEKEWGQLQVQFLTSHKYFTAFANAEYAAAKAKHLQKVHQAITSESKLNTFLTTLRDLFILLV